MEWHIIGILAFVVIYNLYRYYHEDNSNSMTSAALANIAILYPQNKELSSKFIGQIIDIAISEEIREYDRMRWGEDPMDGIYGNPLIMFTLISE